MAMTDDEREMVFELATALSGALGQLRGIWFSG